MKMKLESNFKNINKHKIIYNKISLLFKLNLIN